MNEQWRRLTHPGALDVVTEKLMCLVLGHTVSSHQDLEGGWGCSATQSCVDDALDRAAVRGAGKRRIYPAADATEPVCQS